MLRANVAVSEFRSVTRGAESLLTIDVIFFIVEFKDSHLFLDCVWVTQLLLFLSVFGVSKKRLHCFLFLTVY